MIDIVELVRPIDGFIHDVEIEMLARYTQLAIDFLPTGSFVEIGSYLGRSTVAIAATLRGAGDTRRLIAIDPHEGDLGWDASPIPHRTTVEPTFERFYSNVVAAGVGNWIEAIGLRSTSVVLAVDIGFLFIDGLHDLENVTADFRHFEGALLPGAFILFHDYAQQHWGVTEFVDGLVAREGYTVHGQVANLIAIRKPTG